MNQICIPPSFSELEALDDEALRKIIRMAAAVLKEREPATQAAVASAAQSSLRSEQQVVGSTYTPSRSSGIYQAFEDIPETPVDAEEFAARYNIGVTTLRQQKRFDHLQEAGRGTVHVKKSKRDGRLYVWRGAKLSVQDLG